MIDAMRTSEDYELFIYSLKERFPSINNSTVSFIRRGEFLARIIGKLNFDYDFRLIVRERLLYNCLPVIIDWYGYEVWRKGNKLFWYDSQPHPNDPKSQSTHPHHKHVLPNIKHNRMLAANMSFTRPNLPILISEIESLIKEIENKNNIEED